MNLIVAVDENWNIGKDGKLLCHLPSDLQYFKEKTIDKVVVMGRKTLESLPGQKPLTGRTNVILTGNKEYKNRYIDGKNNFFVYSKEEVLALEEKFGGENVFIIGGGSIYNEFLPYCDTCYITKIHARFDADTGIENLDNRADFIIRKHSGMKEENGFKFQFLEYRRI